jgi:hypothetical protein
LISAALLEILDDVGYIPMPGTGVPQCKDFDQALCTAVAQTATPANPNANACIGNAAVGVVE